MEKKEFRRKILKNGMTVLFEKRSNRIASVIFAVRCGGINEKKEEKGILHFIEHMLYKGTAKRSAREISEAIEKNGGILNGFTDEETTGFWCKVPAEKIEIALDVLSDMVKNPAFKEEEVSKERQVIFEEMKMYKDNPRLYVFDKIKEMMYKGDFAIPLVETEKSMHNNSRDSLVRRFEEVFIPENMILCIVGDADFEKICNFAEENFSRHGKKATYPKVEQANHEKEEKKRGVEQANLVFGYHIPTATKDEVYSAIVLNAVMAEGMSSRLWQEIREKRNLAYAVKGSCNIGKNFGYNTVYAGCKPENVQTIKKLILDEFQKVSKSLDEKELNAVKEQLIGNNRISKEDSQGQMLELLYFEIYGNAEESYEYEQKIKKVKLEDIKKLAASINKPNSFSFFTLIPK